tara:strand:- start:528 stop:677 length:150 start_codon:yes stop_codon:yes gene_type:complete
MIKTNFSLIHAHKYSLAELERMIPWERALYLALLMQRIEKEEAEAEQDK